jgi:4-amino-4-deoxy-L-arabinose transferase-like glycosyltransferase
MHHSQFPATTQMLYLAALGFGGPVAAKLLHTLFAFLSLLAAALLARHFFARGAGVLAAGVLASTTLVTWLATTSYVDMPAVFFSLLGIYFFLHWLHERKASSAAWCGVFLGLAMATKMQALVSFGILGLLALVVWWRRRRREDGFPFRQVVLYGVLAVLVAGPWYLKSYVITGNPVYPFAYSVFGGKQWSAEQARHYSYEQKRYGYGWLPSEEEYWAMSPAQRFFYGPKAPHKMLLVPFGFSFLPWEYLEISFNPWDVSAEGSIRRMGMLGQGGAGPLYLAFLPLLFVVPRRWAWRAIGAAFALAWVWLLLSMHYLRYALPAVAWLAPPAGYAAWALSQRHRYARWLVSALFVVTVGTSACFNWLLFSPHLPVILGQKSPEVHLQEQFPLYRIEQDLNRVMAPGDKLISYGEPQLFYMDRDYLWGDANFHRLIDYDPMQAPADLRAAYEKLGITHVLLKTSAFFGETRQDRAVIDFLREGTEEGLFTLEHDYGPYQVYAVNR